MAFTVNFFNIAKKSNSTLVPGNPVATAQCLLKDGTTLVDPVLLLEHSGVPQWSHFAMEGRYYFIQDIRSVRQDLWEIVGTVDLLATYKTAILATSAFVAYDTTANSQITDKRLSTKTDVTRQEAVGSAFDYIGSGYCAVVNVVGETNCCTYIMDVSDALQLLNTISTWNTRILPDENISAGSDFSTVEDALESLHDMLLEFGQTLADRIIKGFRQIISSGSAASCIKSAFILPIAKGRIPGTARAVELGLFISTKTGNQRTSRGMQDASTVSIPWQASDWRRNAPYHEIYLYIPFVGVVSYPASALVGVSALTVQVAIDETAGDCLVTVSTAPTAAGAANHVIGQYSTNIAANFAIGSSNLTPRQLATTIASAAGTVAASLIAPPAGIAMGAAGIAGELNAATPVPSSIGGAGGGAVLALFGYNCRCMTLFHDTVVAPDSVAGIIGTPAMAVKSLGNLTGYVETRGCSVAGGMTERERLELNRLIDGGIYIE